MDHVPLGEDEREGVLDEGGRVVDDVGAVDGGEEDEGGDLEEADLEGVGGADFHGKRYVCRSWRRRWHSDVGGQRGFGKGKGRMGLWIKGEESGKIQVG